MTLSSKPIQTPEILELGYQWIPSVLSKQCCRELIASLQRWTSKNQQKGTIDSRDGVVVGARNLLDGWQPINELISLPKITSFIREHCGPHAGLVRVLFFDKPPGVSWALATHRDRTIAVQEHHDPPSPFSKPTNKAGVPHVEADDRLLDRMLTLRFHLDDMHTQNGPMTVMPGSHRRSDQDAQPVRELHCQAGDVLAMKPLLLHGSLASAVDTMDHRRVIHCEFAPSDVPAPNHKWQWFVPVE